MSLKKKSLSSSSLYLILDHNVNAYGELLRIAVEAAEAGVDICQIRDKFGQDEEISSFIQQLGSKLTGDTLFIVNDKVHLYDPKYVDGVHVGQDDSNCQDARKLVGDEAMIGVSCQSLDQARQAQSDGADYIGFGSVFQTKTKPDRQPMDLALLKDVVQEIDIPVFAIGGITLNSLDQLMKVGVRHFAVCRAISESKDVGKTVSEFKKIIS